MPPKKSKSGPQDPSPNTVHSRDVLQRLNYLYQASTFLASTLPPPAATARKSSTPSKQREKGKGKERAKEFLIPTQAGQDEVVEEGGDDVEDEEEEEPTRDGGEAMESSEEMSKKKEKKDGKRREEVGASTSALRPVSRMLVRTMRDVAKKATLRMDPAVKRTLCKGCSTVLVPGLTCKVRVKPSGPHAHLIISTCQNCQTRLRLPAPPHLPAPLPIGPSLIPQAVDGSSSMEIDPPPPSAVDDPLSIVNPSKKKKNKDKMTMTKREKREKRQARRPAFFEREGHVTFQGNDKVVRDL